MSNKILDLKKGSKEKANIPAYRSFRTEKVTLSDTGYNEINVPAIAGGARITCDNEITVGESATAAGFPTYDFDEDFLDMDQIYIKGTDGAEVTIVWRLLK
jgi:hypothetical protein